MATAIPISLAAVNLAKVFLFVFALVAVVAGLVRGRRLPWLSRLRTPLVVTAMLGLLAVSLLYTAAPLDEAAHDLGKYGKLLEIPLILVLVRTRREALMALALYAAAQTFILASSYLLSMGVTPPWVYKTIAERQSLGAVFSSYLDQSIMTAGLAALCWQLRGLVPGRRGPQIAVALAALCAFDVLFLLPGRSGQAALLTAIALALWWGLPRRGKWLALAAPPLLLAAAMAVSPSFRDRIDAIGLEASAYRHGDTAPTSTAVRLNYWQRSLEMIAERPLTGWGVGSWSDEYRRLEGNQLRKDAADLRNPHQEYLMWGAQLGVGGVALLLAFLVCAARDARPFAPEVRKAAWSMTAMLAVVCLFNAILFDAFVGDYFCVMLGLLLALGVQGQQPTASFPQGPA
ncbi:MAG: O-antigen ligase family protein [Ramlibacter sp.]